jgi:signal transduction histidine kinase
VVEAHGGNVFVETSSLGGASFVVELPAVPEEE